MMRLLGIGDDAGPWAFDGGESINFIIVQLMAYDHYGKMAQKYCWMQY